MKKYIESIGIIAPKTIYRNMTPAQLTEKALGRGEGSLCNTGALVVSTGKYTGRSPDDKFIVDLPSYHNDIDWGKANVPISVDKFDSIYNKMMAYLQGREIFVFDGFAGADEEYHLPIRVINELASQAMFIHQLLIRPTEEQLKNFMPGFTIIAAPGFKCIPEVDGVHSEAAILVNLEKKMVIIAGSQYAGEIKKSIFSIMNYFLPKQGVFSMHCSANVGQAGDVAVFFGLSGTGKTTLSADPNRKLIGDDEHGWSDNGVFNIEGGCYAKCINLTHENEPQIWEAIKFGSLVENVVMDPETRKIDFSNGTLTENTRAGYPVDYIPSCVIPSLAGHPKTVVFLTADAFGVIPPVSKLNADQAMYHFVSGYTSKLAGTERGIVEPKTTFSTCFAAPFLPLPPSKYAHMLGEKIAKHGTNVYLINTGWAGGKYGVGSRMKIKYTRAMVTAALNGDLEKAQFVLDPIFNVMVPTACPGVPDEFLSQRTMWKNDVEYEATAKDLASRFVKNFLKYKDMPEHIINAGPKA